MPGIQGGYYLNEQGDTNTAQLMLMKDAGATHVRIGFRLGAHYQDWTTPGSDGINALNKYDFIMDVAEGLGLTVLGNINNESWPGQQLDWEQNSLGDGNNNYMTALAVNAELLMNHFQGRIWTWEIWNEPDAWTISPGRGGSFIYPSNFVALLRNIRTITPHGITLVSGGLFVNDLGSTVYSAEYMDQVFSILGDERPFDMVGIHIYIRDSSQTLTYYNSVNRRGL